MTIKSYTIYYLVSGLLYLYGVMVINIGLARSPIYPIGETISSTFSNCLVLISVCTSAAVVMQCSSYAYFTDKLVVHKTRLEHIFSYGSYILFGMVTPAYILFVMMITVSGESFLFLSFLISFVMMYVLTIQYVCFYKQPKEAVFSLFHPYMDNPV
ncbi:hypothetical protein [Radiobacillus deserti]|uniref:Uncharacterized protein n=1 Tax=Radiobacillus deserti TaxID=2594883 RepID=A0A516KH49_9BACI|nr:hypothetical protein [Radiobacillus deserti]QDP40728.1 hypothetical protein FN924_11345 [Radiobacillus deserti]